MEQVLVVGAGGFVGSAIVRALAASGAFRPVSGVRRMPAGAPGRIEHRVCDATDPVQLAAALAGVSHAVNAVLGDAATMTAATRNLCNAASRAGLRRVVHVSSISVYGRATGLVDESAPLDASGSDYGAAKIECETIVRDWMAAGRAAVILRPGIVFGPGGEQWIGRIARLLRAGRLGDLGPVGEGFCNLIHADDVGAAVAAALAKPAAAGEAFNLATPSPPRWNEFFTDLGHMIGLERVPRIGGRRLSVEAKLLAPPLQVAKLAGARIGLRPGRLPEPIPPSLLSLFAQPIRLDPRKSDRVLGFCRTDDAAGLAACAAWFAGQADCTEVTAR